MGRYLLVLTIYVLRSFSPFLPTPSLFLIDIYLVFSAEVYDENLLFSFQICSPGGIAVQMLLACSQSLNMSIPFRLVGCLLA